jgi:hypothetical protein
MFWDWLTAIRRETLPALLAAFSLASTILTFIPQLGISASIRSISIACLVAGFVWANMRVYAKQQKRIADFSVSALAPAHRAKLVIHEAERSKYIALRKADHSTEAVGVYIEFHMAVENKGQRHSSINRYDVSIREMGSFENLRPESNPNAMIPGIHANYTASQPYLMTDAYIRVEAEKMSQTGYLPFRIASPPPISGPLHCTLILTDTEGESTSHEFILPER